MESRVRELLKKNHLSITDSRLQVLSLFYKAAGALAHADIEKKAGDKMDRVTIYRTLQTFEEKGLIHTIPTSDNSVKYALCKEQCAHGHHHDNHVHFICNTCSKTICLDDVLVPEVKLPKSFVPTNANMVVNGICKDCK
ncbi:MAG: Fur family transcriptional regulator [Bacteroidota bacterium]|jgi:Fur family ferric uptake transcriptional regulator